MAASADTIRLWHQLFPQIGNSCSEKCAGVKFCDCNKFDCESIGKSTISKECVCAIPKLPCSDIGACNNKSGICGQLLYFLL